MPNIDFPSNPSNGATYSFNNGLWTFNGNAWIPQGTPGPVGATGSAVVTAAYGLYLLNNFI